MHNYWGQRSTWTVFLRLSWPYFLRHCAWSSLIWIGWLDQWVPRVWLFLSPLPLTTLLGLQVCTIAPGFYVTTTDLNSGPSAWTPSTLSTELSPWAPPQSSSFSCPEAIFSSTRKWMLHNRDPTAPFTLRIPYNLSPRYRKSFLQCP